MISGLIPGTLFTLFVLPAIYNIIKSKLIDLQKQAAKIGAAKNKDLFKMQ
ncbi:hypothetical protein SFB32_08535 [Legionella pneumophila]|nr:hypothetical protein [Legionella pneumophila]AGH52293.1 hypothetical protein LPE509_00202 [Legionella pneumophila subsp. pneumophila LPE509]MDW9002153.1 hypothetical protein [Legionella pneumophila]WBV65990.1 hypothetical protein PGH44_16885 [Legionella pneumophila]WBV70220.1 hypothetical protein PGH46_04030 [Legionella pneumophila]HAT2093701.1 hypothetical protein [Legionella pneumophila]